MPTSFTLAPMLAHHAEQVLAIHRAGIEEGNATFETAAPSWEAFDAAKLPDHRLVALGADGTVTGWVAVSPAAARAAYAGVVEHSVYVHPAHRGRGIARTLLDALITSTEQAGIWTIQAGVFPENTASLALHAKVGFRTIGTREKANRGKQEDIIASTHVVEQILDRVLPRWRTEIPQDKNKTVNRWCQHREAVQHADAALQRDAEVRRRLGDDAPRLSAATMHPCV